MVQKMMRYGKRAVMQTEVLIDDMSLKYDDRENQICYAQNTFHSSKNSRVDRISPMQNTLPFLNSPADNVQFGLLHCSAFQL